MAVQGGSLDAVRVEGISPGSASSFLHRFGDKYEYKISVENSASLPSPLHHERSCPQLRSSAQALPATYSIVPPVLCL